jgi:hypothetical protein
LKFVDFDGVFRRAEGYLCRLAQQLGNLIFGFLLIAQLDSEASLNRPNRLLVELNPKQNTIHHYF